MVKQKKEDPVFIDLDLNRVQKDEEPVTETPTDVVEEPITPPPVETSPVEEDVVPPVEEDVVPSVEEPVVPPVEEPVVPSVEEDDPEAVLKKALGLEEEAEKVIEKLPESEEKKELQSIIDQKQAIIDKLINDKDELLFTKETGEIEKNEMKRLYGNLDEDDSLKQLVLYSNKAKTDDTFKKKRLNVLKEMLKVE